MDDDITPPIGEFQKGLDPESIKRLRRDWDRGIETNGDFSISASVLPTIEGGEQDRILVVKNNGGLQGENTQVTEIFQMDDDIRFRKPSK